MIFIKDGNLYFQDGIEVPVELTHIRESTPHPILSDDNQKVVFFRQDESDINSINIDGSHVQTLITNRLLPEFLNQENAQAFVPGTHLLLFNTYECESQEARPLCAIGLSRVDTDTGEIKKLVAPGKPGQYNYDGNFKVSPNGKMVSVVSSGHIDLISLDGKIISRNIMTYTPSMPIELFPAQGWQTDSNGLVMAIPASIHYGVAYAHPSFTVWRYSLDDKKAVQIPLDDVPPMYVMSGCGGTIDISPDGNWILYVHGTEQELPGYYLGNLRTGHTKPYGPLVCPGNPTWSPDSKQFIYADKLGFIDKPPIQIDGIPMGWIDADHFMYLPQFAAEELKFRVAEIHGEIILSYYLGPYLLLIKPK